MDNYHTFVLDLSYLSFIFNYFNHTDSFKFEQRKIVEFGKIKELG